MHQTLGVLRNRKSPCVTAGPVRVKTNHTWVILVFDVLSVQTKAARRLHVERPSLHTKLIKFVMCRSRGKLGDT